MLDLAPRERRSSASKVKIRDVDVVRFLVEHGVDVTVVSQGKGRTGRRLQPYVCSRPFRIWFMLDLASFSSLGLTAPTCQPRLGARIGSCIGPRDLTEVLMWIFARFLVTVEHGTRCVSQGKGMDVNNSAGWGASKSEK